MTPELAQILTNQSGAVVVAGIFAWYIKGRDERDQKIHRGYMDAINSVTNEMTNLKQSNEAVYSQNWKLVKDNKKKDEIIKCFRKSKKAR